MSDQTQATLSTQGELATDLTISKRDRVILRRLAAQVAELAARPIEQEKRNLWYRHNALEPTRPLIFCDPENGWNEIITPQDLECEGELARRWEMTLRAALRHAGECTRRGEALRRLAKDDTGFLINLVPSPSV